MPLISEVISSGGVFRLYPKGTSMLPLLVQEKDSVLLASPTNIKKHDIVLYLRENDQYVLHRVMKINNGVFTMCGDNQFLFEKGIKESQILAKVVGIYKENKFLKTDDKEYILYIFKQTLLIHSKRIIFNLKRPIKAFWRFFFANKLH